MRRRSRTRARSRACHVGRTHWAQKSVARPPDAPQKSLRLPPAPLPLETPPRSWKNHAAEAGARAAA
eukprot:3982907-Pyramimonas_sp.AAC.1